MPLVEYIWLDGSQPMQKLRSKTRYVTWTKSYPTVSDIPEWSFDGSSTGQSDGNNSDLVLKPVRFVNDPFRSERDRLVLCEVYDSNGNPHSNNTRAKLRKLEKYIPGTLFGFEQEYFIMQYGNNIACNETGKTMGSEDEEDSADIVDDFVPFADITLQKLDSQGKYYCGVGTGNVFARQLLEAHANACNQAGLMWYGMNFEVAPGQAEFQIGPRDPYKRADCDALLISDHLWLARWILIRLAEEMRVEIDFSPKPFKGDWNGSGCHVNFSTPKMLQEEFGSTEISRVINSLSEKHVEHLAVYGSGNEDRLTGEHETCDASTFKAGSKDRTASIRIPLETERNGYGYLEDRRPAANCDPYLVTARILQTIFEENEE